MTAMPAISPYPRLSLRFAASVFVSLLAAATPAAAQAPPGPEQGDSYIRPFSFGGRFAIHAFNLIDGGEQLVSLPQGPAELTATAESTAKRFGGGPSIQFAFHNRYAVSADFLFRRIGYNTATVVAEGVDNTSTEEDDRKFTYWTEDTSARAYEVPILLRRFNRTHREEGWRRFYQAGVVFRRVSKIRTFFQTETEVEGSNGIELETDCCDETPIEPSHRTAMGIVIGAGLHLRDDVGISFVPEIRFTRWLSNNIDRRPARSGANQLEVVLGLSF